jgi:hypothetical protein
LRFRRSGGRIGICGVHTILRCAVKLKHARQITSPCLKDIPSGQTSPPVRKVCHLPSTNSTPLRG